MALQPHLCRPFDCVAAAWRAKLTSTRAFSRVFSSLLSCITTLYHARYIPSATRDWPNRTVVKWISYLTAQGLTPSDLGGSTWVDVTPSGRSAATTLPMRRRFYWTVRFLSVYSAAHMAAVTRAAEKHFYEGMIMFANWNNFHGRLWVPGPLGNNGDKGSLDAGYGSNDWFDFGRMRGTTCLWTEDWFGDGSASQWS